MECTIDSALNLRDLLLQELVKIIVAKVKQSHYLPGQALTVPEV